MSETIRYGKHSETIRCGKPVAFQMTGIGSRTYNVCVECAELGQLVADSLGNSLYLERVAPKGRECEQRIVRKPEYKR